MDRLSAGVSADEPAVQWICWLYGDHSPLLVIAHGREML